MKKIQVYAFRHGETDWNKEHRLQGQTDVPLNENGVRQAHALAETLSSLQPEIILTSDLQRAHRTAELAAKDLSIPIITSSHLRETLFGEPEGMLLNELTHRYGEDLWRRWISPHPHDLDISFPGGETKRQVRQRVHGFLDEYFQNNLHLKRAAVSTHGGVIKNLIYLSEGSPQENVPTPNCSIYELEFFPQAKSWKFIGLVIRK